MSGRGNPHQNGYNYANYGNYGDEDSFVFKSGRNIPKAGRRHGSNQRTLKVATRAKFSSEINGGIETYKRKLNIFQRLYPSWDRKRNITISKLTNLLKDVHEDQFSYNKNNLLFKELNIASRRMRNNDNFILDFVGSMASLATDVAGGFNSVVQACNIDDYIKKFGEIMKEDIEITKPLYSARSSCFEEYRNVEEIIRRYDSETFGTIWNKITKELKTEEMWSELKNCISNAEFSQIFEKTDGIFSLLSGTGEFSEIYESIEDYIDSNPVVLDACESTAVVLYGICDTYSRGFNRRSVAGISISTTANQVLMLRQASEIDRLQCLVSNKKRSQSNLESKIRDAIIDLEREAIRMQFLYERCVSFSVNDQI